MQKVNRIKKAIAFLLIMVLSISFMSFSASAAGTNYEVDVHGTANNNDTMGKAHAVGDDDTNYGAIDTATDVDWWKITFSQSGVANFWLGNIPSGKDYSMHFYSSSSTGSYPNYDARSLRTDSQELIKANVRAGTTYYVKIESQDGTYSSSNYTLRIKRNDYKKTRFFTSTNYRATTTNSLQYLWNMGFDAGEYLHNHAKTAMNSLSTTDIFVFDGYAETGKAKFTVANAANSSYMYANNSNATTNDANLSSLSTTSLSATHLMIFAGSNTGSGSTNDTNLVKKARAKGAFCVIGWKTAVNKAAVAEWVNYYFQACEDGYDAYTATNQADNYMKNSTHITALKNRECGTSYLESLSLAK